jgi:hypothetical protein
MVIVLKIKIIYIFFIFYFFWANWPSVVDDNGFFSSLKVPQLSSNLTNVVDNDGFWMLQISLNYVLSLMTMGFWNKQKFNFKHLN